MIVKRNENNQEGEHWRRT